MLRSNPIFPDPRIEKEAMTLGKSGYNVTLIGWLRYGDAPIHEEKTFYKVHRIKFRAPLGIKIIVYLPFWWFILFSKLMKYDWDIVHAADFDTYIPALIAAKIKKKKVVYDIFDFYVDMISIPGLLRELIKKLEVFLTKYADAVIIVDPSRIKQLKIKNNSLLIIFNSPQDFLLTNINKNLKSDEFLKLFYAGNLSKDRDVISIIKIVKNSKNLNLEIAGWGECEKKIVELIKNESRITFHGLLQYDEVLQKTIESDLLFALYDPSIPNNRYASPNKLFEAMMCRKPIIVSDGSSMADIVRKENCGLVVPYGDVEAIKHAILTIKDNPELCNQLGRNGRKAYEQKYSWKIMEERLLLTYKEINKKL